MKHSATLPARRCAFLPLRSSNTSFISKGVGGARFGTLKPIKTNLKVVLEVLEVVLEVLEVVLEVLEVALEILEVLEVVWSICSLPGGGFQ